jgi:hypothetical protein
MEIGSELVVQIHESLSLGAEPVHLRDRILEPILFVSQASEATRKRQQQQEDSPPIHLLDLELLVSNPQ